MGMWIQKYNIEAVADTVEFGEWKHFIGFQLTFPTCISSNICYYINAGLLDIQFMYGVAQGNNAAAQRIYIKLFSCRNLQITEHLSIFIGKCAWMDRFMLPDMIWELENTSVFLQWKKQQKIILWQAQELCDASHLLACITQYKILTIPQYKILTPYMKCTSASFALF